MPSLAEVILGMDYLNEFFATVMADNKTSLAIRTAVGLGKHHLNKYYGLTDAFPACQIALREFYHPSFARVLLLTFLLQFSTLLAASHTSSTCDGSRSGSKTSWR